MIDFGAESQPGPRPYNEDSQLIRDLSPFSKRLGGLLGFLIVCDGMGGHQGGDVASRLAVEIADKRIDRLVEEAGSTVATIDPEGLLTEIADAANAAIVEEAQNRGVSMGATYVAAFVTADRAWVGHIGDSRAYLLRGGEATQLTADHSQVGRLIADGVLTEEQAQHHPNRNVIERALGFSDGSAPDLKTIDIGRDDVLLLCTDGLSTVLTGADLAQIVSTATDLREAARDVVSEAIRLGSDDNTTAVLWTPGRSAKTLTGRDTRVENSRRRSRERRAQQRHSRASRASYAIGGLLVAIVLGYVVGTVFFGGGGGGGARPAGSTSGEATSTSTRASSVPTGQQAPARRAWVVRDLKGDEVYLYGDKVGGEKPPKLAGPLPAGTVLLEREGVAPAQMIPVLLGNDVISRNPRMQLASTPAADGLAGYVYRQSVEATSQQ